MKLNGTRLEKEKAERAEHRCQFENNQSSQNEIDENRGSRKKLYFQCSSVVNVYSALYYLETWDDGKQIAAWRQLQGPDCVAI